MERFDSNKAIKNDALLRIFLINAVVIAVLAVVLLLKSPQVNIHWIFFGISGVAFILMPIRYLWLKSFAVNTVSIKATIIKLFYYRGSKILRYEYNYQGEYYKGTAVLKYNSFSREMKKGEEIDIVIKENHPKSSLIRELYFNQS
ncbi:MAG TPA: hypothetical protein PKU69_04360 [Bacillota bacterium]|nr:hypothetical protein [Bacillota bacterium]HPJ24253.1 hypothetical protein [Bacillota bacterium]